MLAQPILEIKGLDDNNLQIVKKKVYENIFKFLENKEYLTELDEKFNQAKTTHLSLIKREFLSIMILDIRQNTNLI